jgi:hypothetical protein
MRPELSLRCKAEPAMRDEAKFIAAVCAAISCGVAEIVLIAFGEVTYCSAIVVARCTRSAILSEGSLVSATIFERIAFERGAPLAAATAAARTAFSACTLSCSVPAEIFAMAMCKNALWRRRA